MKTTMGTHFLDAFSYLHVASGISIGFWIDAMQMTPLSGFFLMMALNVSFELLENTDFGMKLIQMVPLWPGGKDTQDSGVNMAGDILMVMFGYLSARMLLNSEWHALRSGSASR